MEWSQAEALQRYLEGGWAAVYPDVYGANGIVADSRLPDRWRPLSSTVKLWRKSGAISEAQAKAALSKAVKA